VKKTLSFALLATLFSAQAKLNTVKVFDGSLATCKTEKDVNEVRNQLGAYRAKALSATLTEDENVQIKIALSFLQCVNEDSKIGFKLQSPLETITSRSFKGDEITIFVNKARVKSFKDGVYTILSNTQLDDKAVQVHTIEVPLKEILNAEGSEHASLDLFIQKDIKVENTSSSEMVMEDVRSFGKFRIHLKVDSETKKVTIK